jgi:hypothetical protein
LRQPRNGHRSVDRILSLARREAEVAIRWARPERGELVARRIVDVPYALYRARDLPLTAEDRQVPLIGGAAVATAATSAPAPIIAPETVAELTAEADKPLGFEDGNYKSRTKLGNYRPFRHRRGPNRAVPPGTKRTANEAKEAVDAR